MFNNRKHVLSYFQLTWAYNGKNLEAASFSFKIWDVSKKINCWLLVQKLQTLFTSWSYSYLPIFRYNQFNIFEFTFDCLAIYILHIHHNIFQVVVELYDKKFNPVFDFENFHREYGNKQVLTQSSSSCSKLEE